MDAVVADFDLTNGDDVLVDYSSGSGTSYAIYTRQIVIRGTEGAANANKLLIEAGFVPPRDPASETYLLTTEGYEFFATLTEATTVRPVGDEQTIDGSQYLSKIGDVRITITTVMP